MPRDQGPCQVVTAEVGRERQMITTENSGAGSETAWLGGQCRSECVYTTGSVPPTDENRSQTGNRRAGLEAPPKFWRALARSERHGVVIDRSTQIGLPKTEG